MFHRNSALFINFVQPQINFLFHSKVLISASRSDISQFVEIALLISSLEISKIIKEVLGNFPKDGLSKALEKAYMAPNCIQILTDAIRTFKDQLNRKNCRQLLVTLILSLGY